MGSSCCGISLPGAEAHHGLMAPHTSARCHCPCPMWVTWRKNPSWLSNCEKDPGKEHFMSTSPALLSQHPSLFFPTVCCGRQAWEQQPACRARGKLKLKKEEYPLHKEEFLIWDEPSVDEWGQPGEMGGCRYEPRWGDQDRKVVSFKKRNKGCDGDSVRLQWVCAQIKADGRGEKSLQLSLNRQGLSSCTCASSRAGLGLPHQVCLPQHAVIIPVKHQPAELPWNTE